MRILYWLIFTAMLGVYVTMLAWSIPAISQEADGLAIFDMRPGGYGFDEARAFLEALNPKGKAIYLGLQQRLDLAYPALLAIFTGWSIFWLAPEGLAGLRLPLALLAVPGMVFDYLENVNVAGMLRAGPEGITVPMVGHASLMTLLKSVFDSISLTLLLVVFAYWLWRRWRPAAS